MQESFYSAIDNEITKLKAKGLYKSEKNIASPQRTEVTLDNQANLLNFCANDYLGLASNQEIIETASASLDEKGFGMASVRFICGTNSLHRELEKRLSDFLGYEDCILYVACFDANGGLFEPLFGAEDAIISDALNHASLIDGIRLCKAKRFRYNHSDMADLELQLQRADQQSAKNKIIVSDGVFSMDGTYAKLDKITELAEKYNALVMLDDCHATGFVGQCGKGTAEHFDLLGKVDILTGTLGKALGGASGGFTCARKNVVELLKQKSRPYLFSNALSPSIVAASLKALEIVEQEPDRRKRIFENARYFRDKMTALGFNLKGDEHPIIPVMLGDANLAQKFSKRLTEEGIFAVGFFFPVVPEGQARIRLQINSEHTKEQLDFALKSFEKIGKELNIL